jgi:O-antigen biosynthesis protein
VTGTAGAAIAASVIVVSRGRPRHLRRCLAALAQQDHPHFEVVIVADAGGLAAVRGLPVKAVAFERANISAARNLGLASASGKVVAFIDDDAVAEPTWLRRLVAPFADPSVQAATGFVRGRDGLSWQSRGAIIDRLGQTLDLPQTGDAAVALPPPAAGAIKTVGTNMAFRRSALAAIGGFDPAIRFYLDEGDVNQRLACMTTIVPDAVVHHAFAANAGRAADRSPTDLHEIGASLAVFLRKHAVAGDPESAEVFSWMQEQQRRRLLRHVVTGGIEPRDVARLLATLSDGWADGGTRSLTALPPIATPDGGGFRPFSTAPASTLCSGSVICGRIWQAGRLRALAARQVAEGRIVTLILLSPTARPHRLRFSDDGYWEQTGGVFGRAGQGTPRFIWSTFRRRVGQVVGISSLYRQISA